MHTYEEIVCRNSMYGETVSTVCSYKEASHCMNKQCKEMVLVLRMYEEILCRIGTYFFIRRNSTYIPFLCTVCMYHFFICRNGMYILFLRMVCMYSFFVPLYKEMVHTYHSKYKETIHMYQRNSTYVCI